MFRFMLSANSARAPLDFLNYRGPIVKELIPHKAFNSISSCIEASKILMYRGNDLDMTAELNKSSNLSFLQMKNGFCS